MGSPSFSPLRHQEKQRGSSKSPYWSQHEIELAQKFWIDPDSELYDKEFDLGTFSEQGFSVGEGSFNLDGLKHRGKAWATLHAVCIYTVMLGGEGCHRDRKTRPGKVHQVLPRIGGELFPALS